jgi:hypothetical protein
MHASSVFQVPIFHQTGTIESCRHRVNTQNHAEECAQPLNVLCMPLATSLTLHYAPNCRKAEDKLSKEGNSGQEGY